MASFDVRPRGGETMGISQVLSLSRGVWDVCGLLTQDILMHRAYNIIANMDFSKVLTALYS